MATPDIWTFGDRELKGLDLTGLEVEATDGTIGKVDMTTHDVGDSYIVVDTGVWKARGSRVLIPAGAIVRPGGGARPRGGRQGLSHPREAGHRERAAVRRQGRLRRARARDARQLLQGQLLRAGGVGGARGGTACPLSRRALRRGEGARRGGPLRHEQVAARGRDEQGSLRALVR